MEIVDNKALLLRTRSPDKYNIIPCSKVVSEENGISLVAVRWGLEEVRVLKNLGVREVPSPINGKYTWPGRFVPMEHQKETSSFLTLNNRSFVFSEPGTGKTLSALWAADYLMRTKKIRRCLILCPVSIMHSAWMSDLTNSIIHRSAIVAHHQKASRRVEMVQGDYEFVIINYDGLNLVADEINANGKFDLVIADEANAYKNVSTKRWKSLNKILKPDTLLWMMTGTPAAQSPLDAYGLAKLVNPKAIPRFFTAWRDLTMNKITMFKWMPKKDAQENVHRVLQPAVRFTKAQCLDLPPVITLTRAAKLTAQQQKYYLLLKQEMIVKAAGETISAVNAATEVNKLLQISAGAAYADNGEVVEFDCSSRLNVLMEALEETDRKVLVFATYRHSIDTIVSYLESKNISCKKIDGSVSVSKRTQIFKNFQTTSDPRVLVIQPQSAAHGVTLTAADTVVFWGPVMSTETYIQCCARSDRKGQDSDKVTVIHIEGSDIERKMFKRLASRVKNNNLLVELYEEEIKTLDKK